MSGIQPNNYIAARQAIEQAIINLRDCIDHREILANSPPVDPEEFDSLSGYIWDTRVGIAQQIRRFGDARSTAMLINFYHRLIGTMPDDDGYIP
ncbi:D-isomer specific 2-hydroxyacid dehydrogenase NAD-binding [Penicillium cf. griseofulvum]|uniref:D-isomer specific 2-hydroxyacid dehydrogenase NAD-binding n=1 Tax=Penicillium cf. griseofulvum TaxID=2972120 RepID=A0A9W9MZQ2_9EURO|nr:D-isomer specific 2-hydroxyacid dehydrogenase NAD-binding [Penicillium cf. griseofulvum]